ncbi:MAG: peptidase C45 acyl-coenzyme A:6-aminopenicillanic acid acyl-transferase, partial [Planctomycetaceae bacterium]
MQLFVRRMFLRTLCVCTLTCGLALSGFDVNSSVVATEPQRDLIAGLRPLATIASGREDSFSLRGDLQISIDGSKQPIELQLNRYDSASFDLQLSHPEYALTLRRRSDVTVLLLPRHGTAFVARGEVSAADSLAPANVVSRMISSASQLAPVTLGLTMLSSGSIDDTLKSLASLAKLELTSESGEWRNGNTVLSFPERGQVQITADGTSVLLTAGQVSGLAPDAMGLADYKVTELDRAELERTFVRGVRRATEILSPGSTLTDPAHRSRSVENGTLQWIDGHRVVTLWGTPEELGTAHGKLLPDESRRCIESVLYSFGTANVVRTGRGFRHDLQDAWDRLAPHIPERHKRETDALARSLQLDPQTVQVLNVFPELFHCSGFAVFGSATRDGKLYHGRVLDYMTTIGLQDAATTFLV